MAIDAHDEDKSRRLAEVIAAMGELPEEIDPDELTEFVRLYFARSDDEDLVTKSATDLAGLLGHHIALGERRRPGEDLIDMFTPDPDETGWGAGGSTIVQIVTDDRTFLVDTVSMELTRRNWSIRHLYHPQFSVARDAGGMVVDIEQKKTRAPGVPESWMCLEVYPPLGSKAAELIDELVDALRNGLARVREAVEDWEAMQERVAACAAGLEDAPQPVSLHEVRQVTELLRWLMDDHFAFLGYHEYTVRDRDFAPVPGTGLGILRDEAEAGGFAAIAPGRDDHQILVMTKDSRRSPVQRPAYLDYIGVRVHNRAGDLVGEHRFLGLFSATAYTESVGRIPLLADKAKQIAERSGFDPDSHGGHVIQQVITTYPRDELFQASVDQLFPIIDTVVNLQERRQVRAFLREGTYGRFLSCTVYLPRDRYDTAVRLRIQELLLSELGGESLEYQASVSESVLARLFFVIRLPDGARRTEYDVAELERRINAVTRSWDDIFNDEAAGLRSEERGVEYGEEYEATYSARTAVADLRLANHLAGPDDLQFSLYVPEEDAQADVRFKVLARRPMSLTEVLPHLAVLGVEVTDERSFTWDLRGEPVHVYDFGFRLGEDESPNDWDAEDRRRFCHAFAATYRGEAHPGKMNRLVMTAKLEWRQVSWLRGIGRYLQQAGIPFSQMYVAAALNDHPHIAAAIVDAFEARFDPSRTYEDLAARRADFEDKMAAITASLDEVTSLDSDRILRMILAVLRAIVRTNAFSADQPALSFKILPRELSLLPEPRPAFEIFVYSPRVQGVHLRFGSVARGGLRWSDRLEDFRTEVLGLVKAQMVKNTVIVPVGAKGGFVPQHLPDPRVDRAAWLAEGIACYQTFVGSLLSVTDNLVDGETVPPPDVVRYDGDDSYLVVAADKGTATFSDIANEISVERGFWLGDAFASGGSAGYDHKAMGITARGAWESVRRHFYELGVDCQAEDFTCAGIGDMAGDVFGNGMLLSRHTRLVAAFNHLHVFLDPDPDPEASFEERKRLFGLERSTWADYDESLISAGGGVFERTAKSIPVSPEAREVLGLAEEVTELTPAELITAILKAPVDLLWNGGIGTYVKASTEQHAEVGDKANDGVRVNGRDVRARIAGEGGNLGWTQKGRIEYALAGGRINTDFIDNSAGVDTSDHEVNIKILLQPEVQSGALAEGERNELLASMTDDVARHVLGHNVDQNLALAAAEHRRGDLAGAHESWMRTLEESGHLDRELESLPSSAVMAERMAEGGGLTRPELATLLSYTKIRLEELVLASTVPDDPYLADRLVGYFPKALRERFATGIAEHPLRREIISTVTVNRFVNSQGMTAYYRLAEETQSNVDEIVRAQLAARSIMAVARDELALPGLEVDAAVDTTVRIELQRMVERVTRWILHNRRGVVDIREESDRLAAPVAEVRGLLPDVFTPHQRARLARDEAVLLDSGVEEELARRTAAARYAHMALAIVEVASDSRVGLETATRVYFLLAEQLSLDLLAERINDLAHSSRWDTMARASLRDDLQALHAQLTCQVLASAGEETDAEEIVKAWRSGVGGAVIEAETLREICDGEADLARMSVALRTLRSLLA